MRPFDPALASDIKPVKGAIGTTAVLAFLAAIALVVQALFLSQAITRAFLEKLPLAEVSPALLIAAVAWIVRTSVTALNDSLSRKFGLQAVAVARNQAVEKLAAVPSGDVSLGAGGLIALFTRGIEGLEIYVARYLPQLVISAIVPLGIGAVIWWLDPASAVIIAITIPLIPLFMALIGWFTAANVERHWSRVTALSASLADFMSGLPELTIFGRAKAQAREIQRLGEQQQTATMKVLRLSFLSAFALELLATISVAIVAVAVGLRLSNGEMELWRGLAALILAPEVYAPIRMVGVQFHAAADGLEAWSKIRAILQTSTVKFGGLALPTGSVGVQWSELHVQRGERSLVIPSGEVTPQTFTVVVGPSGCGKSTLLNAIVGTVSTTAGEIEMLAGGERACRDEITSEWFARSVGYVAQNAWLGEGSVREVLTRNAQVNDDAVRAMLDALQIELSLDHQISDRSQGVSLGQRRRLAVARALLRKPAFVLIDEPGAALDDESELAVVDVLRSFVESGGTVMAVAHRAAVISAADHVIEFSAVSDAE